LFWAIFLKKVQKIVFFITFASMKKERTKNQFIDRREGVSTKNKYNFTLSGFGLNF